MSRPPFAVSLVCARCRGPLMGTPEDAALACLACAVAYPVAAAGLRPGVRPPAKPAMGGTGEIPLLFAAPPPGQKEAAAALPFWRFEGLEPGVRLAGGGRVGEGPALAGLRTGFVLAARVRRFQVYGDPGLEYTRRPPRLDAGAPCPMLPIARTLGDAVRVLRGLLARIATEAAGSAAAPVAVEPAWERVVLWCVSTIPDGAHVKLPHCPIRFPGDLVEGYRPALARPPSPPPLPSSR